MKDKSIRTRFQRFLKKNNLTISFVQHLIEEYAYSDLEVARSYFTEKYNISEHVFYKCRDFAIICNLVSKRACKRIKQKSQENYRTHNDQNTAQASVIHFKTLEDQREEFMSEYSDEEIKDIAKMYADGIHIDEIASQYLTGRTGINELLYKGITDLTIDKKTLEAILKLMPGNSDFVDGLLKKRKKSKDHLLSIARQEMDLITFKIDNHSLYFMFDKEEEKPTLEDLRLEYRRAISRYGKIYAL